MPSILQLCVRAGNELGTSYVFADLHTGFPLLGALLDQAGIFLLHRDQFLVLVSKRLLDPNTDRRHSFASTFRRFSGAKGQKGHVWALRMGRRSRHT